MKSVAEMTACVVDHGLFLPLAVKLRDSFKRMIYWNEWRASFPKVDKRLIGEGYDGIERPDHWLEHKSDIDIFIFPDVMFSWEQLDLQSQGKLVWGSRSGDAIELKRGYFLDVLKELNLPVPPNRSIMGLTNLRHYLRDKEDVYIKISKYRGTMETFHWRSWRQDESWLDARAVDLGPIKDQFEFFVFDALDTDIEIGADTFCVDGKFPTTMFNGLEAKDKGYLASIMDRNKLPKQLQDVLDAFGPVLGKYSYRNAFSSEVRVVEGTGYFIDATCRFPVPGSGAEMEIIDNLADIIVAGALGELVEPETSANYSAECVLTTKGARHEWRIADFPNDVKPHIRCADSCEIDGRICYPPIGGEGEEIGWIVSSGNTIRSTVEQMKERVKMLPDGVHACTESLFDLLTEAIKAEGENVPFSEQPVPEPEIALSDG